MLFMYSTSSCCPAIPSVAGRPLAADAGAASSSRVGRTDQNFASNGHRSSLFRPYPRRYEVMRVCHRIDAAEASAKGAVVVCQHH